MIEKLTNNWDRDNKNRIDRNFANLGKLDLMIMDDFFNVDPSVLTPKINGLERKDMERDMRDLNNFGTNVTAEVNSILHKAWVFSSVAGKMAFGCAEQERNGVATSINNLIEVDLISGWNKVTLNFPLEQNKSYTIFKRNVNQSIQLGNVTVDAYSDHPFISNGLKFNAGKFINEAGTYKNYFPFFEIELITSLAQVYKIANDSVKPSLQIYVGSNPPLETQFWFKPVGE